MEPVIPPRTKRSVDSSLLEWPELEERHGWSGLLIGNGASRALWDDFRYESLYETAMSGRVEHPLSDEDRHIFQEMNTRNFEQVLSGLATTRIVCEALDLDVTRVNERYESIQTALFEAVTVVHVPWHEDDQEKYAEIRKALSPYEYVYSTNYDLITYWAIMAEGRGAFKDYFWSGAFDITDTEVWGKATKVLYLHGGIHLARLPSGKTYKRVARDFFNLLESLQFLEDEDAVPLFITEGSAGDKLSSMYRSDYLAFAYQKFSQHSGPAVIFGQSLSDADSHLTDAMRRWGDRQVAVSVYPTRPEEIVAFKAELHKKLPNAELLFFDSTTHPLGSSSLRVEKGVELTPDDELPF